MLKRADKILVGILIAVLILINIVFIAAFNSYSEQQEDVQKGSVSIIESNDYEDDDIGENEDNDENEKDVPITGSALEQASASALAYIGEGKVTDTKIGDEEGYYEIEITLDNGREVDVHLDENFNVLSVEYE
ncbi:MAG: hypothetical protein AABY22_03865 [Nanoarchaeota archaeon]